MPTAAEEDDYHRMNDVQDDNNDNDNDDDDEVVEEQIALIEMEKEPKQEEGEEETAASTQFEERANGQQQQQQQHDGQEEEVVEIEELPPVPLEFQSQPKSLACARTTPLLVSVLIPLLAIATHGLFLYGQIEPMWRLTESQTVDVWANATGTTAKIAFDTVGMKKRNHLVIDTNSTIQTFTYSFAILELWEAKGMPGTTMPRIAALLLVLFSGIWPHLKLLLLNVTWLFEKNSKRRTKMLHWLSCLGKWSLADILVVCVMVGVLHIDWYVDPGAIKTGLSNNLAEMLDLVKTQWTAVDLCSHFLDLNCAHPSKFNRKVKCEACISSVKTAFSHPDWAGSTGKAIMKDVSTSGEGVVSLRVVGMRGIYAFCAAVVFSILLSLFVDMIDMRAKQAEEDAQRYSDLQLENETQHDVEALNSNQPTTRYALMPDDSREAEPLIPLESHLQLDNGSVVDDSAVTIRLSVPCMAISHGFVSLLVLILSCVAASWVTLQREVHGAIPTLIHDILAMNWTRSYSLHTLALDTGAAGGWDYLLMGTFALFIVFGPIVRSALCVVCHLMPHRISTLQTLIDLIGAFCAWEVLVLAVIMICLLMPSITGTIVEDERCAEIDETGNCFQVEFEVMNTFALVLVGGGLLVLVSNSFSCFYKKTLSR